MLRFALPHIIAVAILLVAAYGAFKWWQVRQFEQSRGEAIPVAAVGPPLTEFELTERSGKPFRTADMKGKVWVATYFFTTCPGNCIRLNQNIKFMHNMPELKDVTWVSITCDPDNDTVEALARLRRPLGGRSRALAVHAGGSRLHEAGRDGDERRV